MRGGFGFSINLRQLQLQQALRTGPEDHRCGQKHGNPVQQQGPGEFLANLVVAYRIQHFFDVGVGFKGAHRRERLGKALTNNCRMIKFFQQYDSDRPGNRLRRIIHLSQEGRYFGIVHVRLGGHGVNRWPLPCRRMTHAAVHQMTRRLGVYRLVVG